MTETKATDYDHMERRKRTPFDYLSSFGGAGSAAIGAVILNLLMHQNTVLDHHSDLIQDNKQAQDQVMVLLKDMQQEFTIDIQGFQLKHENLSSQLQQCEVDQRAFTERLSQIERKIRGPGEWRDIEESLRLWVEANFERRSASK